MTKTFTLPNGATARSASQRRYVIVAEWQGRWSPAARSDNLQTLLKRGVRSDEYLVDTHTGQTLRSGPV